MVPDPSILNSPVVQPSKHVVTGLALSFLAVVVLAGTLAGVSLLGTRDALRQRAGSAAENLSASLEQTIDAELTQVDTALRNVIFQLRSVSDDRFSDPSFLASILAAQLALVPELDSLRVTDSNGIVRADPSGTASTTVDLSDRDFFQLARDAPESELVMSGSLQARISKKWVLVLARRLAHPDGRFAGVVYANLSTEHFQRMFASVDVGQQGAVTLRTSAMRLIARHSPGQAAGPPIDTDNISAQLADAVRRNPRQGTFTARTALDQIERINAYRQVGNRPLLVLVGFDTAAYFAPWRSQLLLTGGLLAIMLAVLICAVAFVLRAWRREAAHAEALLVEGRKNHALLLTASDGIHVLDRDGILIELSHSFASMLGSSREAMLGRHVSSWDAHLDPAVVSRWLHEFQPGQRHRFETSHRRADDALIDVEITSAGVRIGDRELIYCSARDITDRKRLESQLAESAAQIQDLYDNAPCGYHSLDAEGRFLHVNATELAWLGYAREELIGKKHAFDFFTEAGCKTFNENFPRIKSGGELKDVELDLIPRNGAPRRVSLSAVPVLDKDGVFVRSRSVLFDVTELHRTKERLASLSREQEAMLDNEMIGIAKFRERHVVWKNAAMDRIFGYAPRELLGQSTRVLHVDDDTYASEGAAAYPLLDSGGHYRQQLQMRRNDGALIWIDANGTLVSPETAESLWMFIDITPIKRSQAHVEHIAFHDGLTGLSNRLLFADRLQQGIAYSGRHGSLMAVCFLDLDGFKKVNDEFGHEVGDHVLKQISGRLQSCVRTNDTVSRLGGDEFVLLMTGLESRDECLSVLARVTEEVQRPVWLAGAQARVSASVGVAFFPSDAREPEALMRCADAAMYKAKRNGRNQVQLFSQIAR